MFDKQTASELPQMLQEILFVMAVANSCVNPIVYGSYSRKNHQGTRKPASLKRGGSPKGKNVTEPLPITFIMWHKLNNNHDRHHLHVAHRHHHRCSNHHTSRPQRPINNNKVLELELEALVAQKIIQKGHSSSEARKGYSSGEAKKGHSSGEARKGHSSDSSSCSSNGNKMVTMIKMIGRRRKKCDQLIDLEYKWSGNNSVHELRRVSSCQANLSQSILATNSCF